MTTERMSFGDSPSADGANIHPKPTLDYDSQHGYDSLEREIEGMLLRMIESIGGVCSVSCKINKR